MMTMTGFATLAMATLLATGTALLLAWMLLRLAFSLMRPATAKRVPRMPALESELVRGTAQLVRVYATQR